MKFELKNIGPIKEAEIEVGNLTLICGKNNTGKTYLAYSIWGFLKNLNSLYKDYFTSDFFKNKISEEQLEEYTATGNFSINLQKELSEFVYPAIGKLFIFKLSQIFNHNNLEFLNSIFRFKHTPLTDENLANQLDDFKDIKGNLLSFINSFDKETNIINLQITEELGLYNLLIAYSTLLFETLGTFILPTERNTIRLFLPDIDKSKSDIVKQLQTKAINGNGLSKEELESLTAKTSNFPLPIQDNLDFARDLSNIVKHNSFLQKEHSNLLQYIETELLNIEYVIHNGQVLIKDNQSENTIPYHLASTSTRTLADLHLWLKHRASKNSILFIDEPELSLHPENQIKITRLFAKLVNVGIKVFITTHSDYIVKELNNLVMLSNDFPNKTEFMKKYGYEENDVLKTTDIKAYIAENGTATAIEVDKFGMVRSTFDEAIEQINEVADELSYQFAEDREEITP